MLDDEPRPCAAISESKCIERHRPDVQGAGKEFLDQWLVQPMCILEESRAQLLPEAWLVGRNPRSLYRAQEASQEVGGRARISEAAVVVINWRRCLAEFIPRACFAVGHCHFEL